MSRADWLRVSCRRLCPICGKRDWCMTSADGSAAICARVESDRRAGEAGYLHRLSDLTGPHPLWMRTIHVAGPHAGQPDLAQLANQHASAADAGRLAWFARLLGASISSLLRPALRCRAPNLPERCKTMQRTWDRHE